MKKQSYVDESLIKCVEEYNLDVSECNVSKSGISKSCLAWCTTVQVFNVLDQTRVDIMHNFLKGVCKYNLSFLISYYVLELKALQTLNERIMF